MILITLFTYNVVDFKILIDILILGVRRNLRLFLLTIKSMNYNYVQLCTNMINRHLI